MHDISPLNTVRANTLHSVNLIGYIMGHFVRHRFGQIVIEEFGENKGIVAYQPILFPDFVHTGRASCKIESDWNEIKMSFKYFTGLPNETLGLLDDTLLLGIVYGGYLWHINV